MVRWVTASFPYLPGAEPTFAGLSKKHIMEGVDAACKRLQIDYVDLVFCHRPDALTPTETIVRAMTDLVRVGKATAWGTSEWSAQQITEVSSSPHILQVNLGLRVKPHAASIRYCSMALTLVLALALALQLALALALALAPQGTVGAVALALTMVVF